MGIVIFYVMNQVLKEAESNLVLCRDVRIPASYARCLNQCKNWSNNFKQNYLIKKQPVLSFCCKDTSHTWGIWERR